MNVLVISPHPDDETLGCGGALMYHKKKGDNIYWLNITNIFHSKGWPKVKVEKRKKEISKVKELYGFTNFFNLKYATTELDTVPISKIINDISEIYNTIKPEIIFAPHNSDVHTDHKIVFKALSSTFKWFRHPYIKSVLLYETLSETDFNFLNSFTPNTFINISDFLDKKIQIMSIYKSEIKEFPFPRSEKSIQALAALRGSQSGFDSAEAFQLIYQKYD